MITDYLKAGFPAILLQTQEPHRADELMRRIPEWQICRWDCVSGVHGMAPSSFTLNEIQNPVEAVQWLSTSVGNCLVMVSPLPALPIQLQPFFHLIEMKLPDEEALMRLQAEIGETTNIRTNRKASRLATGLTEFQAETAFSLSLVKKGYFSSKVITEAKAQMIKKSGLLELYPPADMQNVGGLKRLKSYIQNRAQAYAPDSSLPRPKGILLVGIPGTGKSLSARAVASMLDFPLLRLDIGQLKNSLVGESERRIREATKIIDAFGNCSDGGTTSGMFSHFLTWMNDQNKAFIVATANNIRELPAEFLRSGRFDSIWFVDLPALEERREIIAIMNRKYGTAMPLEWAEQLNGYTGSELEQIVRDSLFDGLEEARKNLIPLSRTMKEEIDALRSWAMSRARIANTPDAAPQEVRKIRSVARKPLTPAK